MEPIPGSVVTITSHAPTYTITSGINTMAIGNVRKIDIALRLINKVSSLKTRASFFIRIYREETAKANSMIAAGAPQADIDAVLLNAKNHLGGGLSVAKRTKSAFIQWRTNYAATHGVTTAQINTFLDSCLTLVNGPTLAELNTELNDIDAMGQTLANHFTVDGWTLDQVATAAEAYFIDETKEINMEATEAGYLDYWE